MRSNPRLPGRNPSHSFCPGPLRVVERRRREYITTRNVPFDGERALYLIAKEQVSNLMQGGAVRFLVKLRSSAQRSRTNGQLYVRGRQAGKPMRRDPLLSTRELRRDYA